MNIGQAAKISGVSAKMIRYYESIGLMPEVERSDGGYRIYQDRDLHWLRFIRRSRSLGFGMDEIAALLTLWQDQSRASQSVKTLAQEHIHNLEQRIAEMQGMVHSLRTLVDHCHGDQRPDCPILTDLAGG
jgi:MerR family copper efflux transcriptional regulator